MTRLSVLALALVASACGPGGVAAEWTDEERAALLKLEWTGASTPDPTNRFADDARAVELGRKLFFDPAFSRDATVSCATCHDPARFFTDSRPVADIGRGAIRNAPTVVGAFASPWLFWDGRKDSLWSQALSPLENPLEHGFTRMEVARTLALRYRHEYEALFGPLADFDDARFPGQAMPDPTFTDGPLHTAWLAMTETDRRAVNEAFVHFGKAVAAYERTLSFGRSPFDEYAKAVREETGSDALSHDAKAGLRLFIGRADCVSCHDGPRLTNDGFHNLGLPPLAGHEGGASGRQRGAFEVIADEFNCRSSFSDDTSVCAELDHLEPSFADFAGAFRTPSLRNVKDTAPYMHQGQLATLEAVVDFYSDLPGTPSIGHRELTLKPLHLTPVERRQLVAFLESLSGPWPETP